jgi:hypothetical protein
MSDNGRHRRTLVGAGTVAPPFRPLSDPSGTGLTRIKATPHVRANVSVMPWDEERYPVSMRRLDPHVRAKAAEIANALLEEGYDEGKAIRIAIAKAKEWAAHHARSGPSGATRE